jgi:hypothetical protein
MTMTGPGAAGIVAGVGAAVLASRLQMQNATVGVVITIVSVFLATYTQQRHTLDAGLDTSEPAALMARSCW